MNYETCFFKHFIGQVVAIVGQNDSWGDGQGVGPIVPLLPLCCDEVSAGTRI